jgi:dolichol kinase
VNRSFIIRKLFHAVVLSCLAASTYIWGRQIGILAGTGLLAASIVAEVARRYSSGLADFLEGPAKGVIKEDEKKRVIASTYAALASLFVLAVFSESAAVAGISLLALGDPAAAVSGKLLGRRPGKTKEGMLGCITACSILCYLVFGLPVWLSILLGATGALAEILPVIDDNISIPLLVASVAEVLDVSF